MIPKIKDEFSGTLTLTENSTKELFRVLKEQDETFISDVLDGKYGFTLKSADGRSVKLIPADKRQGKRKFIGSEIEMMSDGLIKREDAIKAVWGDDINPSEDGMVFEAQSHIDRDIRLSPSADRPTVVRVKTIMKKEEYDDLEKRIKQQNPNVIVIPHNTELVTPVDRPRGEWIDAKNAGWKCTVCGKWSNGQYDYCPNCGARMKGASR